MILTWLCIFCLLALLAVPECRTRVYMVPCATVVVYAFLNQYPECARRASRRKLTYEDLEDLRDADPSRKRFQVVHSSTTGGWCFMCRNCCTLRLSRLEHRTKYI